MALIPCNDLAAADWLIRSDLPWVQLVTFGPAGFETYARLRFIPDPAHADQEEGDVLIDGGHPSDLAQVQAALVILARHTTTPDDVYVAYWEGWGLDMFPPDVRSAPRVRLPHRDYFLLQGRINELTPTAQHWPGHPNIHMPGHPAFVWPADRAWCVAVDVDPHWAGIGGSRAATRELMASTAVDVVAAEPDSVQPNYR